MPLFRPKKRKVEKLEIEIAKDVSMYGKESRELIALIQRKRLIEIELSRHPNVELERELDIIIRQINALDENVQRILKDIEACNTVELRHVNKLFEMERKKGISLWPTPGGRRLHYRSR